MNGKEKDKISIIIPIYKVEQYLNKCIKSVTDQTYSNLEIILVDDGSPDNCPSMCDEWAKLDSRIKVIHKDNGGLSEARNVGMKAATGQYIMFVDSDDFIEVDACQQLLLAIGNRKPDIVVGNAKIIQKHRRSMLKHRFITTSEPISGREYLKKELKSNTMFMAAWLNLYNHEFLKNNMLEFKVGLMHEDELFTPIAFLKAEAVIGTDIFFYNYLIRNGSITKGKDKTRNAEHILWICKELQNIYAKIADPELKALLNDNLVNKFLHTFQISRLHRKKYSVLIDRDFLRGKAYTQRNKFRVNLFCLSKTLYYYINKLTKLFKGEDN